jgi:hypothetical protein
MCGWVVASQEGERDGGKAIPEEDKQQLAE